MPACSISVESISFLKIKQGPILIKFGANCVVSVSKLLKNFLIDQGLSVGLTNLLITIIGIIIFIIMNFKFKFLF